MWFVRTHNVQQQRQWQQANKTRTNQLRFFRFQRLFIRPTLAIHICNLIIHVFPHWFVEKKVFFALNLIHFFAHDILAVLIQFFISNGWYWFCQFWKSDKILSGTAIHRVIKSTFGIHCSFRDVQWMWKQEEDCAFPLKNYCSWLFCRLNFTISFGKKRLKNNCAWATTSFIPKFFFHFRFLLPS